MPCTRTCPSRVPRDAGHWRAGENWINFHRVAIRLIFIPVFLLSTVLVSCDDIPDGGGWWRILNDGDPSKSAYSPRWTEDGQNIVFLQERKGPHYVYVVNSDGSGLDRILKGTEKDHYTLPHISPDSSRIVYATTRHTFNKREEERRLGEFVFRNWEIETADLDGSDRQQLTSDLLTQDHSPAWSPDGSRIAFVKGMEGVLESFGSINVINADGSGDHEVVSGRPEDGMVVHGLVWSPDGGKLAYVMEEQVLTEERLRSRRVLYTVNADGADRTRLFSEGSIIGPPAWSPDGTRLAVVNIYFAPGEPEREPELRVNILDGTGSHQVMGSQITSNTIRTYADAGVSWSPDGREILYVAKTNPVGRMHIVDVATGNVREFDMLVSHASWSPDGSRIAVVSNLETSDFYLATMAPDGTDLRPLVNKKGDSGKLYGAE